MVPAPCDEGKNAWRHRGSGKLHHYIALITLVVIGATRLLRHAQHPHPPLRGPSLWLGSRIPAVRSAPAVVTI